jgi:hypothetical protein
MKHTKIREHHLYNACLKFNATTQYSCLKAAMDDVIGFYCILKWLVSGISNITHRYNLFPCLKCRAVALHM